jgi:hypothetical protein
MMKPIQALSFPLKSGQLANVHAPYFKIFQCVKHCIRPVTLY